MSVRIVKEVYWAANCHDTPIEILIALPSLVANLEEVLGEQAGADRRIMVPHGKVWGERVGESWRGYLA